MKRNKSRIHRWLVWLLIGTIIETTAYPLHGQPSTSERQDLKISPKKSEGAAFLQDALRLYNEEMEWDSAIVKFKEALAAGLDADDRAKAYWYLALIAYANDNFQEAEDYMYEMLRAKASFTLPESVHGSKIEEIFELARIRIDQMPPKVQILTTKGIKHNKPIVIVAEVTDKSPLVQVELSFRLQEAQSETTVAMKSEKENRWIGEIPITATKTPGKLAFNISAKDEWQNLTTQSGEVVVPTENGLGKLYLIVGTVVSIGGGIMAWLLWPGEIWPQSEPPFPPPLSE